MYNDNSLLKTRMKLLCCWKHNRTKPR